MRFLIDVNASRGLGNLLINQGHDVIYCGILRLENLPRQERLLLLEETIKLYAQSLKEGKIVIATQSKFRIRGNL